MNHKSFEKVHRRVEVLDRVISWRITEIQAWAELWIKDRQVRNLLKSYKTNWEEWLVHWLSWKAWNHHIKQEYETIIKDVIKQEDFKDCNPIFITEKLETIYKVYVSKETVRERMIENKVWEKKTKKDHTYRAKRPRKAFYWEMSQFDWSYHKWFEDRWEEYCLLLDIDDATSHIMLARLADNEWYENVVTFRQERIKLHGVPNSVYLDKFSTYKVNNSKAINTKELRTHFDRSMRKLWCNLISAHSPQAKWRVERCNWTLQDRLVKELRLAKISSVDEANRFIKDVFMPQYNKQFWVESSKEWDIHIKLNDKQIQNLDWIFAREELRSLWNDYIIQYKTKFYQIEQSKEYLIYPKKQLLVAETIDGRLHIHAWWNSEEKLVNYKWLDYNTVKYNRAKYYWEKNKIKREHSKQLANQKKEEKYIISKERQAYYRAQRLFDKTQ